MSGRLRALRNRLKSIGSAAKITKTLKLIANAKLREAQSKLTPTRQFLTASESITDVKVEADPKTNTMLVICTDRGLCGGVNSNIIKLAKGLQQQRAEKGIQTKMVLVGDKCQPLGKGELGQNVLFSVGEIFKKPPTFESASMIADRAITSSEADTITILFNQWINMASFKPINKELNTYKSSLKQLDAFSAYEFEEEETLFQIEDLAEFNVVSAFWNALYENATSELSGRVTAMDSASRNATELIKKYSIQYNRGRQAAITTELIEIISGANAVASS